MNYQIDLSNIFTVVYLRRNGHFKMSDGPVCSR
jgi:hypothetical protein